MSKECPSCFARTIPVSAILFSNHRCTRCGSLIGVHWLADFSFNIVILVVTLITSIMVLVQMGLYAALLWLPLPIGSLSYIKARFSPLVVKREGSEA